MPFQKKWKKKIPRHQISSKQLKYLVCLAYVTSFIFLYLWLIVYWSVVMQASKNLYIFCIKMNHIE